MKVLLIAGVLNSSSLALNVLLLFIFIPYSTSISIPKPQATPDPMKYTYQPNIKKYDDMSITSLHRYAVKGLSGDSVSSMDFSIDDGTFEDDRRFALLYDTSEGKFDADDPQWLHKVG